MSNKIVPILSCIVIFIIIFNILDFVFDTFITKTGYAFSVGQGLILPVICGIVSFFLLQKKEK